MKFVIITHAEHKVHENEIFAYEPYVKEMNLWLQYVDEVQIVAPVSEYEVSAIDVMYEFKKQGFNQVQHEEISTSHTSRNEGSERNPEFSSGSGDLKYNDGMLKQVQHDGMNDKMLKQVQHDDSLDDATNRHPEFSSGSDDVEHNDELLKQVQHDNSLHDATNRHPEFSSGSHGLEHNDEMLKQVQHNNSLHDATNRHPEFSSGSDGVEHKDKILKQVQHDEMKDEMLKQVQHDGMNDKILKQVQHDDSLHNKKKDIQLIKIPSFAITSFKNSIDSILKIPNICYTIYKAMQWADHIHLRCPGNIGLLGCVVQVLFPNKPKTVKYAGNWDPKSVQPRSYRLQKWIVSNTFLTRNCKVLVYGDWPNQSKNIVPFFTASYSEQEIEAVEIRNISQNKNELLKQVQHDENNRHPEFSSGSGDLEHNDELLKKVQHDENKRHSEFSSGSHGVDHNDGMLKQVQHDENNRHPEFSSGTHGLEHNDELLKQVQHDENNRHPEFSSGSHGLEHNDGMLKQVQHDENNRHPEFSSGSGGLEYKGELLKQVQHDEIATSHTPLNDGSERHPEFNSGSQASQLKFIYVGGLVPGKQPLLSVKVVHELKRKGYNVQLDMYGEGIERTKISDYILDNSLEEVVFLHGNAHKEIVKKAYQHAHFLVFISKSEGWPKVVAEAMFWGCVPLTSAVSCVPEMLGNGSRGTLVSTNVAAIVRIVEAYINNEETYKSHAENAMEWSRAFTLERFEEEIGRLL